MATYFVATALQASGGALGEQGIAANSRSCKILPAFFPEATDSVVNALLVVVAS